jgi:acyl-CoA reductase-like NAD-dependent aldehyde dehydrogenase
MVKYKLYLAGRFEESPSELEVINPWTGQVFATTYLAGRSEIEQAITAGLEAEESLKSLPSFKKFEILRYISNRSGMLWGRSSGRLRLF